MASLFFKNSRWHFGKEASISLLAQTALIGFIFVAFFYFPVTYVRLITENNVGEYATFLSFLFSSCLFSLLFFFGRPFRNYWFALLALGTFFIAMEEISWGQQIIHFETPLFFKENNFQDEVGFHNIRALSPEKLTYFIVSALFFIYGFVFPVLTLFFRRLRLFFKRLSFPLPPLFLSPLFIATAYFLCCSSFLKGDEIGELLMSIALGVLALFFLPGNQKLIRFDYFPAGLRSTILPIYILVVLIGGSTLTYLKKGSFYEFQWRLNSALVELTKEGYYPQAEEILLFLEKNPDLADEELLLNKGRLLVKMNRRKEASLSLNRALEFEMKRNAQKPDDPNVLVKISEIYSAMGNKKKSKSFLKTALEMYKNKLFTTELPHHRAGLHIRISEIYKTEGKDKEEINELLKTSQYELSLKLKSDIEYLLGEAVSHCGAGKEQKGDISWERMREMYADSAKMKMGWCKQS